MKNPDRIGVSENPLLLVLEQLTEHLPVAIVFALILSLINAGILPVKASSAIADQKEQMPGDTDGLEAEKSRNDRKIYQLPPDAKVAKISVAGDTLAIVTKDGGLFALLINEEGRQELQQLFRSRVEDVSVSSDGAMAFVMDLLPPDSTKAIAMWFPGSGLPIIHKLPPEHSVGSIELIRGGLAVYERISQDGETELRYIYRDGSFFEEGRILVPDLMNASLASLSTNSKGLVALGSLVDTLGGNQNPDTKNLLVFLFRKEDLIPDPSKKEDLIPDQRIDRLILFSDISVAPGLYRVLSSENGVYGATVNNGLVLVKLVNTETLETRELPSIDLDGFEPTELYFNEVTSSAIPGQTGGSFLVVSMVGENGVVINYGFFNNHSWQLLPKLDALSDVNALTVDGGEIVTARVVGNSIVVEGASLGLSQVFLSLVYPGRPDLGPEPEEVNQ